MQAKVPQRQQLSNGLHISRPISRGKYLGIIVRRVYGNNKFYTSIGELKKSISKAWSEIDNAVRNT